MHADLIRIMVEFDRGHLGRCGSPSCRIAAAAGAPLRNPLAWRSVDGVLERQRGSPTEMSDQPAGARSFLTTTEPLRQDLLTPTMIAAVGVCAILVIAGIGAALRGPWLDEFWTLELSDAQQGPAGADPRRLDARCPSARLQCLGDAAGVARHHLDPGRTPGLEPARRRPDDPGGLPPVAADARAGRFRRGPAAAHPVAAAGDGVLHPLPILLLADDGDRHARAGRPPRRRDESRSRLAPRPRPGGDRRAGHRRLDRPALCRRPVRRAFGQRHRCLRLRQGAAAVDGPGAGDGGAVEPVRPRQRRCCRRRAGRPSSITLDRPARPRRARRAGLARRRTALAQSRVAGRPLVGRGQDDARSLADLVPRHDSALCWSWAWPSCLPPMLSSRSWSIAISSPSRCW